MGRTLRDELIRKWALLRTSDPDEIASLAEKARGVVATYGKVRDQMGERFVVEFRDENARRLRELGASHCTPEAVEASLQLAGKVLLEIGVADEVVQRRIEEQRALEEA